MVCEQALEIVERQPIVHGQRADDAEAQALVDDAIEIAPPAGRGSLVLPPLAVCPRGGAALPAADCRLPTADCDWRLLAALPTVSPRNDQTEDDVEAAESGSHESIAQTAPARRTQRRRVP